MRVFQTLLAFSGNAQPQLAVTRGLIERGHEVRVLAHQAARERIEATGAEFVPFLKAQPDLDITRRESDTLRDWQAHTKIGAGIRLLRNGLFAFVLDVTRESAELLASHPADVVLFDWMLTGAAVAAEAAHLPAVALVHCPYPLPVAGVPPLFTGLRPLPGRLGAARDGLLSHLAARLLATGLPLLNQARSEQTLTPLRRWEQQLLGAHAICVMTAPELDFSSRGELPTNVHYVGPAFEPYNPDWKPPWPHTNTDPLVVISLSTSYMNQQQLAQRILDALAGLPVRALLTSGPALDHSQLQLPPNTQATPYIPHRSVFPHAKLLITHAGWQTINAALADGLPILCIPDGRDQPDNAARVLASGAGIRVSKHTTTRNLRARIAAALADPAPQSAARSLASTLAQRNGTTETITILEQAARHTTTGHTHTPPPEHT